MQRNIYSPAPGLRVVVEEARGQVRITIFNTSSTCSIKLDTATASKLAETLHKALYKLLPQK